MKKLLYLFFAITLLGCSSDDDSSQKFRNIYKDTFWQAGSEGLMTFSTDKLFYEYVENRGDDDSTSDGIFYEEGSFDNVRLNDCIFGNITYIVIEEDDDTLSLRSVQSNGSGSSPCTSGEFNVVFQIINENAMEYTISVGQYTETSTAVRSSRSFSTNDCVNGTLNGQAWW